MLSTNFVLIFNVFDTEKNYVSMLISVFNTN